jgi:hypothetical protein
MTLPHTQTGKLARSLLASQGMRAIWKLHEAAAAAYREGFTQSAAVLIEVDEAAERVWRSERKCCLKGDLAELIAPLN